MNAAIEAGWIVNKGVMPVATRVKVDTMWKTTIKYGDSADSWFWVDANLTHWRLACEDPPKTLEDAYDHLNTGNIFTGKPITMTAAEYINTINVPVEQPLGLPLSRVCKAFEAITGHPISEEHAEVFVELLKICK
jgi:hypothetical protein